MGHLVRGQVRSARVLAWGALLVAALVALGCAAGEAPDEGAAAEAEPVTYPGAVTADPDHYSVEFENDAVRLLRIRYGPGESSVMHHHPPNCAIFLTAHSPKFELPSGEVVEPPPGEAGAIQCVTEGEDHLPTNAGEEPLELILVEMKDGAAPGTDEMPDVPDSVTADPDHYSTEFENEVIRIVRVKYGPGETSVMHYHPANCVIPLTDAPATFELPSGEVIDAPVGEPGSVTCVDLESHLPTNTGDTDLEVVLVEMKGRAAAS